MYFAHAIQNEAIWSVKECKTKDLNNECRVDSKMNDEWITVVLQNRSIVNIVMHDVVKVKRDYLNEILVG